MTTSKGLSTGMFSLHRRQSALNLPVITSDTAADANAGSRDTSNDSNVSLTMAALSPSKTPMVRTVQSPLTPSGGDQDEDELSGQEHSPTCRRSDYDHDKASKHSLSIDHHVPATTTATTTVAAERSGVEVKPLAILANSSIARARAEELEGLEGLEGVRARESEPTGHLRTLSRDFVLPSLPTSAVRHENCSSLKDQFLKIKERFSPSSPPKLAAVATTVVSTAPMSPTPSGQDARSSSIPDSETKSGVSKVAKQTERSGTLANAIDDATGQLNRRNDDNSHVNDGWVPPQARVERWYREDNFFKGSITCWTMEAGAAIVARVARVASEWGTEQVSSSQTSGNATSSSGGSPNGIGGINPDVSLQWIGRQLWAVTVALPLTRSGELREEHIALAHRINQAVSDITGKDESSAAPPTSAAALETTLPTHLQHEQELEKESETGEIEATGGNQTAATPTQILTAAAEDEGNDQVESALAEGTGTRGRPQSRGSRIAMHSNSSVSTYAADDVEDEALQITQAQLTDEQDKGVNDEASLALDEHEHDDDEPVAVLPLSWSMLSLSSQPSGSSEHGSLHSELLAAEDDSSADPAARLAPDKTGWLKKKKRKQRGLVGAWQQRYFELKGNRLYYFASEADGLPRGAVLLDNALVQRGRGDHAMIFSISSASSHRRLQVLKFSARLTQHVYPRKSIELRVVEETEAAVTAWVSALNRASFYCKLASASAGTSVTLPAPSSSSASLWAASGGLSGFSKKRKTPFYRFRSPPAGSASPTSPSSSPALTADKERQELEGAEALELRTTTARWAASYQQLGSVQYLRETDPLLWEIHPPEQLAIRKKAARARSRSDYLAIFSRHAETFAQIFLPRPQPISLEQTLRDILPELFLINDTLYGGGEQQQPPPAQQSRGLEHIFEVLDAHIQRFAAAPEERVRAVSALLQACARTISGGDSYFVVHKLLGNPDIIIRPAEARGRPIEIDVTPERPSRFLITVFSAFSFHHVDDVERFGDADDGQGGGMTPAPLLRVQTRHIQEFDFASGTATRWLRVHMEGRKEDGGPGSAGAGGGGALGRWGSRRHSNEAAESRIGALLDALS